MRYLALAFPRAGECFETSQNLVRLACLVLFPCAATVACFGLVSPQLPWRACMQYPDSLQSICHHQQKARCAGGLLAWTGCGSRCRAQGIVRLPVCSTVHLGLAAAAVPQLLLAGWAGWAVISLRRR